MMAKSLRPYIMPGVRWPGSVRRPTAEDDPPDYRITQVRPRPLTLQEVRVLLRPGATDPRFRAADRWLQRWTVTRGSGEVLPLAAVSAGSKSRPATLQPLDDLESRIIDLAIKDSPLWASSFVFLWYRTDCSVADIAKELKMKRRQSVYEERQIVLAYYLGVFRELGLQLTFWAGGT